MHALSVHVCAHWVDMNTGPHYAGDADGLVTVPTNRGVPVASSTSMNRNGRSNLQQHNKKATCTRITLTDQPCIGVHRLEDSQGPYMLLPLATIKFNSKSNCTSVSSSVAEPMVWFTAGYKELTFESVVIQ